MLKTDIKNLKQIFEEDDPFKGASEDDLEKRGVSSVAKSYAEWGRSMGLRSIVAEVFGKFMEAKWGDVQLNTSYGESWLERFRSGSAFAKSDIDGQRTLRELGVKRGVDAEGYITDHYSVDEANKYRIRREIKKNIDMSPDELPYTYEDITTLPEYKAIVDLPYITDVTTTVKKNHRTISFMFSNENMNEADDPFKSVTVEDLESRQKEERRLEKIIRKNEEKKYIKQRLISALYPMMYTTHANGYIRYGQQTTGVVAQLGPALHLDDYRRLFVRLKQTLDRKLKNIERLKRIYRESLAQGLVEADDPFKSVAPSDLEKRRDAYRKSIQAKTSAWQDIAKRELEIALECEVEVSDISDYDTDMMTLEAINGTEGNNGESEWVVYDSESSANYAAVEEAKERLESDPGSYSLENYLSMSDTDRHMLAQEEADSWADGMDDNEFLEHADLEDEFDEVQQEIDDLYDIDPEPENYDDLKSDLEEKQSKLVDTAREDWVESKYDDIYSELGDPIEYYVHTHGLYSIEDLMKSSFIHIDIDEAADDFVSNDGEAYWLDYYDGDSVDLPSGAVAFGRN